MTPSAALLDGPDIDAPRPGSAPERRDRPDRAALARAALVRAEERTGTESWVRPAHLHPVATDPVEQPRVVEPPTEPEPGAAERTLPVSAHLRTLLPSGGLDRGTTVVVAGSTSLALSLLAEASRSGGWVALVGLPGVGVLAAQQLGLDLERLVLVPAPGPDAPTVVAALLDGVDVVVVGPVALGHSDRRRLSARARERSSVLLPVTPWPGAHVVLTAAASRWEGLGRGHGRLRSRTLIVQRTGRGTAGRMVSREVRLDGTTSPAPSFASAPPFGPAPDPTDLSGPPNLTGWLAG